MPYIFWKYEWMITFQPLAMLSHKNTYVIYYIESYNSTLAHETEVYINENAKPFIRKKDYAFWYLITNDYCSKYIFFQLFLLINFTPFPSNSMIFPETQNSLITPNLKKEKGTLERYLV